LVASGWVENFSASPWRLKTKNQRCRPPKSSAISARLRSRIAATHQNSISRIAARSGVSQVQLTSVTASHSAFIGQRYPGKPNSQRNVARGRGGQAIVGGSAIGCAGRHSPRALRPSAPALVAIARPPPSARGRA
jgi:hypothetical protein